jgi:hypothetical protein
MADITKCQGTDCPKKESCYRYLASVTEWRQAWFCECPLKNGKCDHYWEYCSKCNQYNGCHKMSCPTQKIQINL